MSDPLQVGRARKQERCDAGLGVSAGQGAACSTEEHAKGVRAGVHWNCEHGVLLRVVKGNTCPAGELAFPVRENPTLGRVGRYDDRPCGWSMTSGCASDGTRICTRVGTGERPGPSFAGCEGQAVWLRG